MNVHVLKTFKLGTKCFKLCYYIYNPFVDDIIQYCLCPFDLNINDPVMEELVPFEISPSLAKCLYYD